MVDVEAHHQVGGSLHTRITVIRAVTAWVTLIKLGSEGEGSEGGKEGKEIGKGGK